MVPDYYDWSPQDHNNAVYETTRLQLEVLKRNIKLGYILFMVFFTTIVAFSSSFAFIV